MTNGNVSRIPTYPKPTTAWALDHPAVRTPAEGMVLVVLVRHAQRHGVAWPKQRTIARQARCSREAANRILARLQDRGAIRRDESQGTAVMWTFPDFPIPPPVLMEVMKPRAPTRQQIAVAQLRAKR